MLYKKGLVSACVCCSLLLWWMYCVGDEVCTTHVCFEEFNSVPVNEASELDCFLERGAAGGLGRQCTR